MNKQTLTLSYRNEFKKYKFCTEKNPINIL